MGQRPAGKSPPKSGGFALHLRSDESGFVSGDLDRNLPRPGPLRLRDRDRENAVAVARRDLLRIHGGGQREGTLEAAVGPLAAMHALGLLLRVLPLLAADGKQVVLQGNL